MDDVVWQLLASGVVLLDLRPHLLGDLLVRALLRRLLEDDAGRVPVRDVDRQRVDRGAVAVVAREVAARPDSLPPSIVARSMSVCT